MRQKQFGFARYESVVTDEQVQPERSPVSRGSFTTLSRRVERASLWFHTLRYLRPVQIYGRLLFKLSQPKIDLSFAPERRIVTNVWCGPACRESSWVKPWTFRFLNEEHDITFARQWNDKTVSTLWLYNLHYFDDLNAHDNGERLTCHQTLIRRWIEENPCGHGVGWEPYPTSLRVVNWIKWALAGSTLDRRALHSLAVQLRWLSGRLENHLLGNHLFANAKALVFGGLFFSGPEAEAWLSQGFEILNEQIPEQILEDGGQFERSTMYHALALEDMLDLLNVLRTFGFSEKAERLGPFCDRLEALAQKMRRWLAVMSHPNGKIAFFNDAAHGIAPDNVELNRYAQTLGLGSLPAMGDGLTHLEASGYIRVQSGRTVAFLDVAPIGPDYLPGHAHADSLSFELSLDGSPVIVNCGTSRYGLGSERLRERGTAAHSTVEVGGQNSSEVWSGFRVARRARPIGLDIEPLAGGGWEVRCGHTGYRRMRGKPLHIRTWRFMPDGLTVSDQVTAPRLTSIARFHFHPETAISHVNDGWTLMRFGRHLAQLSLLDGDWACVEDSRYAPSFGIVQPTSCLAVQLRAGRSTLNLKWGPDGQLSA